MNFNPDKLVDLIRNKESLFNMLLEMNDRNFKQMEGCSKLRDSLVRKDNPNFSNENVAQCASVALATSAKNSEDLMNLSQLLLVYCSGSNFDVDAVKMAGKFGKGDEALKAMARAKFGNI